MDDKSSVDDRWLREWADVSKKKLESRMHFVLNSLAETSLAQMVFANAFSSIQDPGQLCLNEPS